MHNTRYLGDYLLKEIVSENELTRRWLAEQVSVNRLVLVDELKPESFHRQGEFLANVRAKAAVDHPLVGSVYEALSEPEKCFYAHELLAGVTLEDRLRASAAFTPARLTHLLRRISEAHLQHVALGQATSPLGLENVHLDDQGVIRLDNLAVAGTRTPEDSRRDIKHLGETLKPLVADSQVGSTRCLTLLSWMRGEQIEMPLSWEQVRDLCDQIEQQLAQPTLPATPTQHTIRNKKNLLAFRLVIISTVILTAAGWLSLRDQSTAPVPPPKPILKTAILIPEGKKPTPDGTEEDLRAFSISSHEVTIGQYATFIDTLNTLSKDKRERTFDHETQPPQKSSHIPQDWSALHSAAKAGGKWNNLTVSLDSPVVGVDWWDCAAFAEWKQARLPTQEEWFAAIRESVENPATIKPVGWTDVTAETSDKTPNGLIGMAGSVSEWTRRPAANPANPLGERKWVIIGGSFLKPGSNALTREWCDDRSLRRADLGFRIVSDSN